MRYELATPARSAEISRYLLAGEEHWTGLTEKLKRRGSIAIPSGSERILTTKREGSISGLIYNDSRGYTFAAIRQPLSPQAAAALQAATASLPRVRTLLGNTFVVDAAIAARRRKPAFRVDYLLMCRPAGPCDRGRPVPPGLEISAVDVSAARTLYPLQKAYEIEEVLLEPDRFNPLICMSHLRETLKKQFVLQAALRGRPVAKAGTNALGINWAQIGGVFTLPELRGGGIGHLVMRELLDLLAARGMGASLFVKPGNDPAVRLYHGLGFRDLGPFSIAYYMR